MARLQQYYREKVVAQLRKDLGITNAMEVPKIVKITVNMGVGEAVADKKVIDAAVTDLTKITGQKPVVCQARKSIASFKVREGLAIGCKVTLRGTRMYEFLDRLISVAMPRIRDFRGVSPRSFDGRGNYNMGVKEQIIFPEIQYDQIDQLRGMDITITTTAKDDRRVERCSKPSSSPSASNRAASTWPRRAWWSARSVAPKPSRSSQRSVRSSRKRSAIRAPLTRIAWLRRSPFKKCRVMRARAAAAIAARSRVVRVACTASSVSLAREDSRDCEPGRAARRVQGELVGARAI